MKKLSVLFIASLFVSLIVSCGGDGVKLSDTGELLISHQWKLQPNATLDAAADSLQDATGLDAHIELDGDVGDFVDFLAETLTFARDNSDKTKLAYSSTIGEGLFSAEVLGYWEINDDDTELTLYEWDSQAGQQKEGIVYKIVEISDEKLVLENKSTGGIKIYAVK
ncbi:MAG: hypothetical protein JXR68_07925 [Bacteroidales bacterium]|nr:hypothetical protein [Bacteroidales bacterium]